MHRHAAILAGQRQEFRRVEALVAHVERMPQGPAPRCARQQGQKSFEVLGIELLGRHELPDDRAELVAERLDAAANKALDRFAGRRQQLAVGGEAVGFEREHEAVRRLVAPPCEGGRFEGAVVGAVDLDRRQLAAGVLQFLAVRQALGIEIIAPGLVGPAAHADVNPLRFFHVVSFRGAMPPGCGRTW